MKHVDVEGSRIAHDDVAPKKPKKSAEHAAALVVVSHIPKK